MHQEALETPNRFRNAIKEEKPREFIRGGEKIHIFWTFQEDATGSPRAREWGYIYILLIRTNLENDFLVLWDLTGLISFQGTFSRVFLSTSDFTVSSAFGYDSGPIFCPQMVFSNQEVIQEINKMRGNQKDDFCGLVSENRWRAWAVGTRSHCLVLGIWRYWLEISLGFIRWQMMRGGTGQ